MNKAEMIHRLQNSSISHITEGIVSRIRPSIRLRTQAMTSDAMDLGTTRLGGIPDLPSGVAWPHRNGKPLAFIAQIRLTDMVSLDHEGLLPPSGWLYFFYDALDQPWGFDPADRDGWKVMYFDVHADCFRRTPSPSVSEDTSFQACSIISESEDTFPDSSALITEGILKHPSAEFEAYVDLVDEYFHNEGECRHRLLGNPEIIQGEMRFNCQYASNGIYCGDLSGYNDPRAKDLDAGVLDWILLLQVDSDDSPGWIWGDCGRLFFWIRKQDLVQRDFDRVWLELQCS